MKDTVLIVDDEIDLLRGLSRLIEMELGCRVLTAENGIEALRTLDTEAVDVVLTDVRMPMMDGIDLLQDIKHKDPTITVVVMTAYGSIEKAVVAIKSGAYDFIQKPLDENRLIHVLKNGFELNRLVRENARLLAKVREQAPFENMVGRSRPMLDVFKTIQMLAPSDVTVLITGETGTGKDLAAQAIHQASRRHKKSMVTVNCPALPETILESELFGYRKGAFTNALEDRRGLFDVARGGTIFLDEIGDLSPLVQKKLLRVLQDKEIRPLGAAKGHRVDTRIIAATNQNLEEKISAGLFREDLYYRLRVATLTMPPLREISEDIPLLVDHFLQKAAAEQSTSPKQVSQEVMNYILSKEWPGNIRELENTIRNWTAMTVGPDITAENIPESHPAFTPVADDTDLNLPYMTLKNQAIESFTRNYLHQLLMHTGGNVSLSAQISGIKRQSLQKIIKRYGITVENYR